MSNVLSITLGQFHPVGSSITSMILTSHDEHGCDFMEFDTIEEFESHFGSNMDVVQYILGLDAFVGCAFIDQYGDIELRSIDSIHIETSYGQEYLTEKDPEVGAIAYAS